jgi:hypothetical protein
MLQIRRDSFYLPKMKPNGRSGRAAATVKTRMFYARKKLAELLEAA